LRNANTKNANSIATTTHLETVREHAFPKPVMPPLFKESTENGQQASSIEEKM